MFINILFFWDQNVVNVQLIMGWIQVLNDRMSSPATWLTIIQRIVEGESPYKKEIRKYEDSQPNWMGGWVEVRHRQPK